MSETELPLTCSLSKALAETRRPPRVVVVEDNRHDAEFAAETVAASGCHVTICTSGEQALSAVETEAVELMLLDLKLAGMSGATVLSEMHAQHPTIPVVILAGADSFHLLSGAVRNSVLVQYITKPLTVELMKIILAQHNLVPKCI